ncbi:nuclear transport factor 2 family protein [Lacinutrix sp. MEBiC02404]
MKTIINMKPIKAIFISLCCVLITWQANAQVSETSELFLKLKTNDSLLFHVGFNTCDVSQFKKLIAEDFEFYHDEAGVTESKADFMANITNGLCGSSNHTKSRRELDVESLEVFPLYKNGALYGAIQKGEHKFFESVNGGPESKGSIAKFSHVWIKEEQGWKIKRVLSYDHQMQD